MKRYLLLCLVCIMGCVSPQYECLFDDATDCTPIKDASSSTLFSDKLTCGEAYDQGVSIDYNADPAWLLTPSGSKYLQLRYCFVTCTFDEVTTPGLCPDPMKKCAIQMKSCRNDMGS